MTSLFIGLGNMAGALLRGMKASGRYDMKDILGYDLFGQKAAELARELGFHKADSLPEALKQADTLVLAVKPQALSELLHRHREAMRGKLIITIAAGKPIHFYEQILGDDIALIRVMPSIAALAGQAASALCPNQHVREAQLDVARQMFSAVGTVCDLQESLFPVFSAIAAAAPAFVFQMIDALASAGVRAGLSRELSLATACQMALGSAALLKQTASHPRQLMDQVCSPGGTTIEGLHTLDKLGFDHALHEAVAAVIEKDKKLGREG